MRKKLLKNRENINLLSAATVFGAVLFSICAIANAESVKMTGHMPVGHHDTKAIQDIFSPEVEKLSGGDLSITYYPAGQLAMDEKALDLVSSGAIQVAQFFDNRAVGEVPTVGLMWPWFDDGDWWARRMYDPSSGGGEYSKLIAPKYEELGVIPLKPSLLYYPEHSIITKKPVDSLSDYQGMKIRVSGRSAAVIVSALGAKPVVMSSADVYTALQRGTIDGANSGLTSFISRKWYEVAKHVQYHTWESPAVLTTLVNKNWWVGLSETNKKAIFKANKDAAVWSWNFAYKKVENDIDFLKKHGVNFHKYTSAEEEKKHSLGLAAVKKLNKDSVAPDDWAVHKKMYQATKDKTKPWERVFEELTLEDIP